MRIDFEKIEQEVANGFINVQSHPSGHLRIYNYSHKVQFDWRWTPETMLCRGLIVNTQNEIVARPFPKFFTQDQMSPSDLIWSKPFVITAKLDGSLGIAYQAPSGGLAIATRGSFMSFQAVRATEILRQKYARFRVPVGLTALFEILLPENRIVVDYGDTADLFLLTVTTTATGLDAFRTPREAAKAIDWQGPVVQEFSATCKPKDVMTALGIPDDGSAEGLVLRFDYPKGSYTRVKTKTDEYKRLHKILTGINARHIWESLRDGKGFDDIITRVPDEFYDWVRRTESDLNQRFRVLEEQARADFKELATRRETAEYFKTREHPSILFSMLDRKDYAPYIWKIIRPKSDKPFREEI